MKPTVVIHTNDKQMLGALVSAHSFRRNSRNPEAFDLKAVATGMSTDQYVEITGGIAEGDRIVVRGADKMPHK